MQKCPLRYAKVFDKFTCIGNDWEARQNVTTAKIFKNVCKTLFVTVTILSPNFLLNKCYIKIMVDTCKIMENVHRHYHIWQTVQRCIMFIVKSNRRMNAFMDDIEQQAYPGAGVNKIRTIIIET